MAMATMDCKSEVNVVHSSIAVEKGYQKWTSDLERILCMEGGEGDGSYARNSEACASAIALSKPFLERAINCMRLFSTDTSLRIADLGCATGTNTISTLDFVVENIKRRYLENSVPPPEFEAFFSDLPSNDFNTLFRSLPSQASSQEISKKKERKRSYYAAGVPGSFYDRLFPRGKLHVAISLSALHWMSKIPEAVLNKSSPSWNRGRAWIDGARREVVEAYAKQSEEDLKAFLRCRAAEIVSGGLLFLLMAGRPRSEPPQSQIGDHISRAKHPFTDCMDQAWNDLVQEGLIDEETRDAFNIPAYMRSEDEIRQAFDECNTFEIKHIAFQKVMEHSKEKQELCLRNPTSYAESKANLVRATLRPIIDAHLRSSSLSETFFNRFEKRAVHDMNLLNKIGHYGIIVVFALRK